jgi:tetratricopeptide (TPR) repeat protein
VRPGHFDALQMAGIAAIQRQDFAGGLSYLDRALAVDPGGAFAHHNRGVALERLGRNEEAAASYDRALAIEPDRIDSWFNRGNALSALARTEDALASYDRAIGLNPDYGEAYFNRGDRLKDLGRLEEAAESYDRAIAHRPALLDALYRRADVLALLSRWEEALNVLDKAVVADPRNPVAHVGRGMALRNLDRPAEAIAAYDRAIALNPGLADAYFNRGDALADLGRSAEAVASYEKAVALKPDHAFAYNNLGVAYSKVSRFEALKRYDRALAARPDFPEALNNRGNVLRELLRPKDALADYDRAVALKPDYAEAHENRGLVLAELARMEDAGQAFETAISLAPRRGRFYYSLSESRRFAIDDPDLKAMTALAADPAFSDDPERLYLHFALGKALADAKAHEASFEHLRAGAALKRAATPYDEPATLALLDRTRRAFDKELLEARAEAGDPSPTPVFIVGMPRSGSTLVEQILASHPLVHGAGETVDLIQALAEFGDGEDAPLQSPEAAARLTDDRLRAFAASYVRRIAAAAPSAMRITDKALENFRHLGLIRMALPNARIVHTRRNPMDTCVSCFSKLFTGDVPYSYDLSELGRYYRAYDALTAHWRSVLPAGVMLEVQYEDLVDDFEANVRRLVAHCGLPWDPVCLDFHTSERTVRTASMVQVRQPLFKGSVGRWRAYGDALTPLREALGPLAEAF